MGHQIRPASAAFNPAYIPALLSRDLSPRPAPRRDDPTPVPPAAAGRPAQDGPTTPLEGQATMEGSSACSSPVSAPQDTMFPAIPTRMRRHLGQPLEQSGSNVGHFMALGCSQPSSQQSWRRAGALPATALAAEMVVPQCLLVVLFLRSFPKTPESSLPFSAPPGPCRSGEQMGLL